MPRQVWLGADGGADEQWGDTGEGTASAVPAHVIGMGGKDDEVGEVVVEGVAIFVMDNVLWEEDEAEVTDSLAGFPLSVPILEVVGVVDDGVVAGWGAVVVGVSAAVHTQDRLDGAAVSAGDIAATGSFRGVAAMSKQEQTDRLWSSWESLGKGAGGFEAGIPGGEDVGGLSWCESWHVLTTITVWCLLQ